MFTVQEYNKVEFLCKKQCRDLFSTSDFYNNYKEDNPTGAKCLDYTGLIPTEYDNNCNILIDTLHLDCNTDQIGGINLNILCCITCSEKLEHQHNNNQNHILKKRNGLTRNGNIVFVC